MPLRATRRSPHLALLSLAAACASVTSATAIEPGAAFRLGGGQAGAFVVRGTNTGPVAVTVFSDWAGRRDSVATLAPGAPVDVRFPGSTAAVFVNASSTRTATLTIKVTGDVRSLGMASEPSPKR